MGVKAFIYCDFCNPNGYRMLDRRVPERSLDGRRNADGRCFIDGNDSEAEAAGWQVVGNKHYCPRCIEHAAQAKSEVFLHASSKLPHS